MCRHKQVYLLFYQNSKPSKKKDKKIANISGHDKLPLFVIQPTGKLKMAV